MGLAIRADIPTSSWCGNPSRCTNPLVREDALMRRLKNEPFSGEGRHGLSFKRNGTEDYVGAQGQARVESLGKEKGLPCGLAQTPFQPQKHHIEHTEADDSGRGVLACSSPLWTQQPSLPLGEPLPHSQCLWSQGHPHLSPSARNDQLGCCNSN